MIKIENLTKDEYDEEYQELVRVKREYENLKLKINKAIAIFKEGIPLAIKTNEIENVLLLIRMLEELLK